MSNTRRVKVTGTRGIKDPETALEIDRKMEAARRREEREEHKAREANDAAREDHASKD